MMNWLLAILATITSYTLFSIFGLRTGNAQSFLQALLAPISNPLNFALILSGSIGFGLATYYALKVSTFAIPAVISLGVIVAFVFSLLFTHGELTYSKVLGVCLIIAGVWFIK